MHGRKKLPRDCVDYVLRGRTPEEAGFAGVYDVMRAFLHDHHEPLAELVERQIANAALVVKRLEDEDCKQREEVALLHDKQRAVMSEVEGLKSNMLRLSDAVLGPQHDRDSGLLQKTALLVKIVRGDPESADPWGGLQGKQQLAIALLKVLVGGVSLGVLLALFQIYEFGHKWGWW